ncbi:hypothetical protein OJF2_43390 [Aquisphaera giovannonii]|uniref:Uncharacterized protein n=1 Tax=Aquisphaera giovannonii TaxID=406548 RepID=A0A5B9W589_9BACT|nr:hypothetical protein [Aquisphaera giovannonii]QEH35782.1 hypothetical protein OJF2_43390 [Aquisphaera giovannonii]
MKIGVAAVLVLALAILPVVRADAPGASQAPGPHPTIRDFTNTDPASLGVRLVQPRKDPKTGFVVGGKNSTKLLRTLAEINGRAIADLEADMRPGAKSPVGSDGGFLGKRESLLEVMAADNDEVVGRLGLTHQEVARHMHALGAIGERMQEEPFRYHGQRFRVTVVAYRGDQPSPFHDGTKSNKEVTVRNLDSGKQIEFSLLVPFMVERYGFYEGKGTPYRVDPARLLEVLGLIGKGSMAEPRQPPAAEAPQRANIRP